MPFRSVKSWPGTCAKALLPWGALLSVSSAFATTTVAPIGPSETRLENVVNNTLVYYPAADADLRSGAFVDTEDPKVSALVDVTANQKELSPRPNMLRFILSSDKAVTVPPGGQAVILVTMAYTQGARLVPIATIGSAETPCDTSICQTRANMTVNGRVGEDFYYAIRYTPGQTIRFGLYPADICGAFSASNVLKSDGTASPIGTSGQVADGCGAENGIIVPTRDSSKPLQLSFWITTMEGTDVGLVPAIPTSSPDATLTLYFEKGLPTFSCPSLTDVYFPGDQSILLDSARFGTTGGIAPKKDLIVVGKDGASPDNSKTYASSGNQVVERVKFGAAEIVKGFTNTTGTGDHKHSLEFMIRDRAGFVIPSSSPRCTLEDVQTAPIEGFITKNGCFIATAAHGSATAAPVMLLRKFRDRILLKSELGKAFVRWYYSWSPEAADWLVEHPWMRGPVLLALIPFEILAWVLLHPEVYLGVVATVLWCLGVGLFFVVKRLVLARRAS